MMTTEPTLEKIKRFDEARYRPTTVADGKRESLPALQRFFKSRERRRL